MYATALIIPPGTGTEHFVLGDLVTVKIHGKDKGARFAQIELHCGPQVGPPLHIHHREEETFYVVEGEFEFVCGEQQTTGGPGTVALLPRDVPHRFKNIGSNTGRLLITLSPAGTEDFFVEVGRLTREEQTDIPRVMAIAARYGLEIVGGA